MVPMEPRGSLFGGAESMTLLVVFASEVLIGSAVLNYTSFFFISFARDIVNFTLIFR